MILKSRKGKNVSKEMSEAYEDVSKDKLIGFYADIPQKLMFALEDKLHEKGRKKKTKISKREWLVDQIKFYLSNQAQIDLVSYK